MYQKVKGTRHIGTTDWSDFETISTGAGFRVSSSIMHTTTDAPWTHYPVRRAATLALYLMLSKSSKVQHELLQLYNTLNPEPNTCSAHRWRLRCVWEQVQKEDGSLLSMCSLRARGGRRRDRGSALTVECGTIRRALPLSLAIHLKSSFIILKSFFRGVPAPDILCRALLIVFVICSPVFLFWAESRHEFRASTIAAKSVMLADSPR